MPSLENVAFDCADPYRLALFWSTVTGQPLGDGDQPGDEEVIVELPGGPTLFFNRVPEAGSQGGAGPGCLPGSRSRRSSSTPTRAGFVSVPDPVAEFGDTSSRSS